MKVIDVIAAVLLVVGGLNWGLVGAFDLNLVSSLFGVDTTMTNIVYILVGVAAIYQAVAIRAIQKRWRVMEAISTES